MDKTGIMDIEITELDKDTVEIWFVAISGQSGPRINMPYSLLTSLVKKIEEFYAKTVQR